MTEQMKEQMINDFIKRTNVFRAIHGLEGGIIELDSYLKDFLKFSESYCKAMPFKNYIVQAKPVVGFNKLDPDDQKEFNLIVDSFECQAHSEEIALDIYHETIPIACLEDFDITVTEVEDDAENFTKVKREDNRPGGDPTSPSREPDRFDP